MKAIKKEYHIMAGMESVWKALVDPKVIAKWGGGPAKMSDKKGKFSLWGGDVTGENVEIVPKAKLVQNWKYKGWKAPSRVEFKLTHKDGCTTLHLTHIGVPESEWDSIDKGWDDYYLGPISKLANSQ